MHFHLEIVLPPVADVKAAIEQILEPFNEQGEDEDGEPNRHTFWDWYVIGGRWAGEKINQSFDKDKLKAFRTVLHERGITVSGFQAGKMELSPASQIPMVDALWCEHFPDTATKVCPLFAHYNDQYKDSDGFPGIMRLKDMPPRLTASTTVASFAGELSGPALGERASSTTRR